MLRSDRFHISIVGLALFFAALAWLTTPNVPSALEVEGCADQASPSQAYEVRDDTGWARTLRVAPECEPTPSDKATAAEAEQSRPRPLSVGEADLLAQERVAHWTQWIGFFTAGGFVLLYVTFLATRDAVVETRRIGEAQTRAYVGTSKVILSFLNESGDPGALITLHNAGQSPAMRVFYGLQILYILDGEPIETHDDIGDFSQIGSLSAQQTRSLPHNLTGWRPPGRWLDALGSDQRCFVGLNILIGYWDVFGTSEANSELVHSAFYEPIDALGGEGDAFDIELVFEHRGNTSDSYLD